MGVECSPLARLSSASGPWWHAILHLEDPNMNLSASLGHGLDMNVQNSNEGQDRGCDLGCNPRNNRGMRMRRARGGRRPRGRLLLEDT